MKDLSCDVELKVRIIPRPLGKSMPKTNHVPRLHYASLFADLNSMIMKIALTRSQPHVKPDECVRVEMYAHWPLNRNQAVRQ